MLSRTENISSSVKAIPRDIPIKVKVKGGYTYVKLNAAYSLGGVKETKKQVEDLLGIKIDYYASVNMGVLEKVVDAVGGVTVNNSFAFTYEGHHFKKGQAAFKRQSSA